MCRQTLATLLLALSALVFVVGSAAAISFGRPGPAPPILTAKDTEAMPPLRQTEPLRFAVDLRPLEATLLPSAIDDGAEEELRVRFGRFVARIGDAAQYRAIGSDGTTRTVAVDARLVAGSPDEVDVLFAPGTDLEQQALLVVDGGAVFDEAGRANLPAALPISGARPGSLAGPELLDAVPDVTLDHITFEFDRELDARRPPPADGFAFVASDGEPVAGRSVVSIARRTVVIAFEVDVADAVRFVAGRRVVRDRLGRPSVLSAIGGPTGAPDLLEATPVGRTGIDLVFDEPVVVGDEAGVRVLLDDGTVARATAVVRPSPTIVRATFAALQDEPGAAAAVEVDAGAVHALSAAAIGGTAAMRHLGALAAPGHTAGPDPVTVLVDGTTGFVAVAFDEPLHEHRADPLRVGVVTPDGRVTPATAVVEVDEAVLVVTAPPNVVRSAVAVIVEPGAAADRGGVASTPALLDP